MKSFQLLLLFLLCSVSWSQQLVINEIDPDTPSIDTAEFVELKSASPNFSTDGYILVFFNGSSSGGDSSYLVIDLNGYITDNNGLLVLGASEVFPFPQVLFADNIIQNGADAVGIYQAQVEDFPEGTLATTVNLVDALVYGTNDSEDSQLLSLLGETVQYNDNGTNTNPRSIQRFIDGSNNESYSAAEPTPRRENDGSGISINPLTITVDNNQYNEGDLFDITITSESVLDSDLNFEIALNNGGFNTSDFSGNTTLIIPNGQNSATTTITLINDTDDEGDEVLEIRFVNLVEPVVPGNNNVQIRVIDDDFTVAPWGTPINPTFGQVQSTQPSGYYNSLDGLSDAALRQALQDIIADPTEVRAQTYADVIDILKEADQNPENSNQVWLVYTEEGKPKLDFQTGSNSTGKWNREHTFPRSRGGFDDIEEDEIADGIDVFWTTEADSLRHGNSDAHALRAADASENSSRGNQHYGEYVGPTGTLGSFRGDVARGVLYMEIRYNGLEIVNGFPDTVGQLGDLATILDWHRNDPPDDYEMNRNNVVYEWQRNRNPFIDQPLLVEYIWGDNVGETWLQSLSIPENIESKISLYPNPAKDNIFISNLSDNAQLYIMSADGREVARYDSIPQPLPLSLAKGLYLLKIKDGNSFVVRKLIIE